MWVRVPRSQLIVQDVPSYVISHYNIAASRNWSKIEILLTKKSLLYVKTLYKVGAIKNFLITKNSKNVTKIILSPSFYKNSPFYKSVRYVSTPSKKHTISLKALRLLQTALRASIIILSTPYGLITHKEAVKFKTGGIIICILS